MIAQHSDSIHDHQISVVVPQHSVFARRVRTGKVARLPKATRDKINQMLRDNVPYVGIIHSLGTEGADLTESNLTRWREGGYNDWLKDQAKLELIRQKQEFASELLMAEGGTNLVQTTLQIASTNLCDLLLDLDPVSLREAIMQDPDKYTRLLNALARLSGAGISCDRHRAQENERQARLAKETKPGQKRGITPEALRLAEESLNLL